MDKFVNATRLIGVLDSAIARPRARGNAKSIDDMWCDMAMQYTKRLLEEEMSAGGEFRRVVHAHWVDVGGNSICSACRCRSIEDVVVLRTRKDGSVTRKVLCSVLTVELLWTRRSSNAYLRGC